ncbi:unnamed protein product [Effrenium voratum]|uniref:Uncharacterized protein n=1 Tax=Effrenium voratum TaxID=2562239 RepID=A0AA36IWR2_9DINO|nr:unnamed protein product [Effrenium voratum]
MSGPGRDKNVWGYSSNGQDADEFNAAEADKGFGPPSAQELASKAPGAGRAQADMAGYAQQRWTPMNGVPVPAVPPGLDSHMAPAASRMPGMKQSSAQSAAAALQMFEAKGVTVPSRVQAEEAAMATRNRLLTQEYAAQKALPHRQKAEESAKQTASRLQKTRLSSISWRR